MADRPVRVLAVVLVLLVGLPGPTGAGGEPWVQPGPDRTTICGAPRASAQVASEIMNDRYSMPSHPTVRLRHDLRWSEDPFRSRNWRFWFHTLWFLLALTDQFEKSGKQRYLDRALELAKSWVDRNPRRDPASDFSWNDHTTALRALTLICLDRLVNKPWLRDALVLHGATLADRGFYRGRGNHALNQSIGLLEIGCLLGRANWKRVATDRINKLVRESVDQQGVNNEQSTGYQLYNYLRYTLARERLRHCNRPIAPGFKKVPKMARMLAHATQPDGQYVMIGDTSDRTAWPIRGTVAEFAATGGAGGVRPSSEIASFRAGYLFGRTGWGDSRAFQDESSFSLRFGGPRQFHGHRDAGAVTLYGHSSRLLIDPGIFTYEDSSAFKDYMRSHAAHNVVSVAGITARGTAVSPLIRRRVDGTTVEALVDVRVYAGVTHRRRVVFSRRLGYLVVEDRLSSNRKRTYRQLWHLRESTSPVTKGARTWTRRKGGGDVLVWQLLNAPQPRIIKGRMRPVQGWLSYEYGQPIPAPVIQTSKSGRSARFITLLAPFVGGAPPVDVKQLSITSSGFRVVVTVEGERERVRANGSGAWIERLP